MARREAAVIVPPVSVVIPTRNRARLLPGLLAALQAQTHPAYEVIVVDDSSDDGTAAVLTDWGGRVLRQEEPAGSYAARNRGWRAAQGAIIAFTDDDCLPEPDWLETLVAPFANPEVVAVQGQTRTGVGTVTPFTHQIEQRHGGAPYRTCNIAYRRDVLERLGGFDDTLRWYADNILGLRARQLGKIAFAPDAVVLHPPRSREWRNADDWRRRFAADRRHRQVLHELGVEPVVLPGRSLSLALWVMRPLLKQGWHHLRYAARHPGTYWHEVQPMLREKRELLAALRNPELPAALSTSVVIVTHRGGELLRDTLHALAVQTIPHGVVVVDHAGDSETRRVVEAAAALYVAAPGVTLGAARQRGVDAAESDVVAFTDDDCLPRPDWLERLVDPLRRQPRLVGVQGRTVPEAGGPLTRAVQVRRPSPLFQTCNIAYRRAAVQHAGGFDPGFVRWFEDTALGARVQSLGPIGFAPEAVVMHRAMPRRVMDRETWRVLLQDERRLAAHYPALYRRIRGPEVRLVMLARWGLGSGLKAVFRAWPAAWHDPAGYRVLLSQLVQERYDLLAVLRGR